MACLILCAPAQKSQSRRALMNEFMCLVRGLAFQSQWRKDTEYVLKMLYDWRVRAHSVLIPANTIV